MAANNPNDWYGSNQGIYTATTTVTTAAGSAGDGINLSPDGGRVSKPSRRRSRASRRTPTTMLNTDTSNFRAMVQQFTGGPSAMAFSAPTQGFTIIPPSSSSPSAAVQQPQSWQFGYHQQPRPNLFSLGNNNPNVNFAGGYNTAMVPGGFGLADETHGGEGGGGGSAAAAQGLDSKNVTNSWLQ